MKLFRLGSCRVYDMPLIRGVYGNEAIGFTHGVDEHIQLINFLADKATVPTDLLQYVFTFYGGEQKLQNIEEIYTQNIHDFKTASAFLIEICSLKRFTYKNTYLQKSRFEDWKTCGVDQPSNQLSDAVHKEIIDKDTFYLKLDELTSRLGGRKMIFTGHINSTHQGQIIKSRETINHWLKDYCKSRRHSYYDVSPIIRMQPSYFTHEDAIHYKKRGKQLTRCLFLKALLQEYAKGIWRR